MTKFCTVSDQPESSVVKALFSRPVPVTGLAHAKNIFATNFSVILLSTSSKFYFDNASALFYTVLACALAVFKSSFRTSADLSHWRHANAFNFTGAQCPPLSV